MKSRLKRSVPKHSFAITSVELVKGTFLVTGVCSFLGSLPKRSLLCFSVGGSSHRKHSEEQPGARRARQNARGRCWGECPRRTGRI